MKKIESFLTDKGITPTPVRILVYKSLSESEAPVSLSDLETKLGSVDKSTVSRTLSLFKDHGLLHGFNDGSGSMKYELCDSRKEGEDSDRHVHFRCEICGETICLTDLKVPTVQLPEGYRIHEINYVISGVCSNCS